MCFHVIINDHSLSIPSPSISPNENLITFLLLYETMIQLCNYVTIFIMCGIILFNMSLMESLTLYYGQKV